MTSAEGLEQARPARTRRTTGEVRSAVLAAARESFAEHGFDRAGTRLIAEAAGVTQAAIFRHFSTKEQLFAAAVAEPFDRCITTFLEEWGREDLGPGSNTEIARSFIHRFYGMLRSNRRLFAAYLTAPDRDWEAGGAGESALSRQLGAIVERMRAEAEWRGVRRADMPVAVRCAAAVALAFALHDDVLFPRDEERPDEQRILDEMVAFTLAGIERRG